MMFVIMGRYDGATEELDESEDRGMAEHLARERAWVLGDAWEIWVREVPA